MNEREIRIKKYLMNHFESVYCDTCEFWNLSEKEAIEKYDYYGCEWCHRKGMNYKLSENCAENLAIDIMNIINGEAVE